MNKLLSFAALLVVATLAGARAQTLTSTSALDSTSSLSLTSYTDRSSLELRQLRAQIDAAVQETPLVGQSAMAPYVNALSTAEQALADFRTAPNIELDRRQADLENAKGRAIRMWNDFRTARGVSASRLISTDTHAAESTP